MKEIFTVICLNVPQLTKSIEIRFDRKVVASVFMVLILISESDSPLEKISLEVEISSGCYSFIVFFLFIRQSIIKIIKGEHSSCVHCIDP